MQPLGQVESFSFRLATQDEQKNNAPSYARILWEKAQAGFNTLALARCGGDVYRFFGSPIPKGTPCKVLKTHVGLNWYVFSSPEMFRTLAGEHRNTPVGLFANDVAAKTLLDIGSEVFGEQVQPEDTISTCTAENSKKYRMLVARHLGSGMIKQRLPEIDQMADELFTEWKPGLDMDVTMASQMVVSRVINRFLLGLDDTDSLAVAKAIVAGNAYILEKASGSGDTEKFAPHAAKLRTVIDKALLNHTPFVEALHASDLTPIQKRVMLIVIYFTSLGGTISQIGGLMWHLAKNPKYQEELHREVGSTEFPFTAKLLKESFRIHPSTLTIDRPTRKPAMMTYDCGDIHQEMYIPEKSILTFYQPWAAEQCESPKTFNPHRADGVELYPFGHGVHKCVGQFISEELIGRFIRTFTRRFQATTTLEELPLQGYFNLEPTSNVILQIRARS